MDTTSFEDIHWESRARNQSWGKQEWIQARQRWRAAMELLGNMGWGKGQFWQSFTVSESHLEGKSIGQQAWESAGTGLLRADVDNLYCSLILFPLVFSFGLFAIIFPSLIYPFFHLSVILSILVSFLCSFFFLTFVLALKWVKMYATH